MNSRAFLTGYLAKTAGIPPAPLQPPRPAETGGKSIGFTPKQKIYNPAINLDPREAPNWWDIEGRVEEGGKKVVNEAEKKFRSMGDEYAARAEKKVRGMGEELAGKFQGGMGAYQKNLALGALPFGVMQFMGLMNSYKQTQLMEQMAKRQRAETAGEPVAYRDFAMEKEVVEG